MATMASNRPTYSPDVAGDERKYHIGFGAADLPAGTVIALLSGDPGRSELIAGAHLGGARELARNRGLDSFLATLPGGAPVICATSGMGAPSMSIVVNELVQVGVATVIRIGTAGSIQDDVRAGEVVIGSAALTNQGAAADIAPPEFPAVADPFLTVALADAAAALGVTHHVGVMASVDTFFEGQERSTSSANPHLLRRLRGMIDEYRDLGILNFEMEAGTLFKMGAVYGFAAGCVCAIIAQRDEAEEPRLDVKDAAVEGAIRVAVEAADRWSRRVS
jgi:uridine phosphorylase